MPKCQCGKRASFNVSGNKPVCCSKCKTSDMVDVKNKKCPCGKYPSCNLPGKKNPIYCSKCKTDDMIDVVNKRCPCGNHPIYNLPGKKPVYCAKCKTDDMINIKNQKCQCGTIPMFNVPGSSRGICCSKCKTDTMIDVISAKCSCGKCASFNVMGEKKPICCSKCKTSDMVDIRNKICLGYDKPCPVRTQLKNGHDYCMSCDPNDTRRKRYKRYEEAFFSYIKDKFNVHQRNFTISFDHEYTSKKRAFLDGVVFDDGIVVCLEVDEDGHRDYECDEHRMHLVTAELLQKYPDHVVSWVRVNPTVDAKTDWSKKSKVIREKRFDDVVIAVNDILKSRETRVVYIGF